MTNVTYDTQLTALLVIDPYNDFMSDGGKVWDRLRAVAEANRCVPQMLQVLHAARQAELCVCYTLHHRYRPGDYEIWQYLAPTQKAAWSHQTFEDGTWGGEICREFPPPPGDIVALEPWCASGFANTDLDVQRKQHSIHQRIVIGLLAQTSPTLISDRRRDSIIGGWSTPRLSARPLWQFQRPHLPTRTAPLPLASLVRFTQRSLR